MTFSGFSKDCLKRSAISILTPRHEREKEKTFPGWRWVSSASEGGEVVNRTPVSYREARDSAIEASLRTLDSRM